MIIDANQYALLAPYLPIQRGNVRIPNLQLINAVLYVAENGCKWRALPPEFGNWNTVYVRIRRWAKNGVLERLLIALQEHHLIHISVDCLGLDSTSVKVHPDGTGALIKTVNKPLENPRGGWNTKIHLIAANDRLALTFSLSAGQAHDGVEGRKLLQEWNKPMRGLPLTMDRAYEGDETRQLVLDMGMKPVVPPKSNRIKPWKYNKKLYKRRNEVERLFRRLKGFRRIFSRFEKLDSMFKAFIQFALIIDMISVNTP